MHESPCHLIRLEDLDRETLDDVLDLAQRMRGRPGRGELTGRAVGMLFFRGSLRTRASLEVAVNQLGGHNVELTANSDFWELEEREGAAMDGRAPEHVRDAAAVLSRYVDALAIRPASVERTWELARKDAQIAAWARHASVPVINMESALWHPLQALADMFTLRSTLGQLAGKRLAIVWVHSPEPASPAVAHSLLHAALRMGMHVSVAHPPGFDLDSKVIQEAGALASQSGGELSIGHEREKAAEDAHVIYARSWSSLENWGNSTLEASQRSRLRDWTVDLELVDRGNDARVMHAMPIRRNLEISDEVLDGPRSLIYEQAENRLYTQKALLSLLIGEG